MKTTTRKMGAWGVGTSLHSILIRGALVANLLLLKSTQVPTWDAVGMSIQDRTEGGHFDEENAKKFIDELTTDVSQTVSIESETD